MVHGRLLDPINEPIHKPVLQVCYKGSVVYPGIGKTIKILERVKWQVLGIILHPVLPQGLGRVHGCLLDLSNEPIHNPELQVFYKESVVYPGIGQNYTKFGTSKGQVQGFLLDLLFAQGLGRVHGSLLDPCNVLIHKPMLQVCSKGSVVYPGIGQNYKKFGTSQIVGLKSGICVGSWKGLRKPPRPK